MRNEGEKSLWDLSNYYFFSPPFTPSPSASYHSTSFSFNFNFNFGIIYIYFLKRLQVGGEVGEKSRENQLSLYRFILLAGSSFLQRFLSFFFLDF